MMNTRNTAALAALAVLVAAGAARPQDEAPKPEKELKTALGRLAENIQKHLGGRNEKAIVVGQFLGPGDAGPGLQSALMAELKGKGIAAEEVAPLEVRGEYSLAPDPK